MLVGMSVRPRLLTIIYTVRPGNRLRLSTRRHCVGYSGKSFGQDECANWRMR